MDGETDNDNAGSAVSLSADGSKIAVASSGNDGNGMQRGHVRVFQYNGKDWVKMAANIDGKADNDNSGSSVSLSFDGTKVAIGATGNDGGGYNSGHARVFQFTGTRWVQLGGDINGEADMNQSGSSVSMSADGTKLAIGARVHAGGGYLRGSVRIFQFESGKWLQTGATLNGEADNDLSGTSVSMSADGANLIVGAPANGGDAGYQRGHVRVYQMNLPPSVKTTLPTVEVVAQTPIEATERLNVAKEEKPSSVSEKPNVETKVADMPQNTGNSIEIYNTYNTAEIPVFRGFTEGGKNKINWVVSDDVKAKGFYFEKQRGNDWESLGYLMAYDNVRAYNYEDNFPSETINYYRIKTVAKDGQLSYSETLAIDNDWKLRDIKLQTNESNTYLNIDDGGQIINSVIVFSPSGQVLLSKIKDVNERIQGIDIQGLVSGAYLVHVMSGKKIVSMRLLKK